MKIKYSYREIGWMVYMRPGITGIESNDVIDHWKNKPGFPYENTIDQIFEEDQFEGYRSLGRIGMVSLFRKELGTEKNNLFVDQWFGKITSPLLPDNDPTLKR